MKKTIIMGVAAVLALASCNDNKFKVSGTIEGAGDSTTLYLETSVNGSWLLVDSVTTSGGKFSLSEEAPEYPNIYRIGTTRDAIYFPVDSLESIEITTSLAKFGDDYTVSGSDNAVKLMKINKEAAAFAAKGDTGSDAYKKWKDNLSREIVADPAGIVAYYTINKFIGDTPIFDPLDKRDFKIIGAVTNAFANFRPNDPRTNFMVENFKQGLSRRRIEAGALDTIVATEASLIDINLMDKKGKMQSLKEVASHGNVVILNFTMQNQSFSPALNKLLNDVYSKYRSRGLEIFQISLDDNEASWRQAVASLPWIVMREPNGEYSQSVGAYNVNSVPTVFIIGRNGEIVDRVANIDQLESVVAKHL